MSNVLRSQIYASGARRDVNLPEAEAAIETALQLDPKSAQALSASAEFVMDREGVDAAEARLRQAIEINPNFSPAYERSSDMMYEAGRINEALGYAEKGVALDPLSVGLRESLAQSLEAAGRYDDAETQFRRAVEIEPSDPSALQYLAMFEAYVRDRFVLAVSLQEKAVELAPDDAYLVGPLAELYMYLEDDTRAAELLDAATNRWPDRTNLNVMAMFLAMYRGDHLSAGRYASKVLETSPQHIAAIYFLVDADLARNDFAAARARFAFAYPGFLAGVPREVTTQNVVLAMVAAKILLASREDQGRARVLLDRAELAHNRILAPLHGDPVYEAAVAEIRRDMARQRAELAAQARGGS